MVCLKRASSSVYGPAASMDVTADRSMTRWTLSSCRASVSAFLTNGVVFQSTVPVTVHTVVSCWGQLNATVVADLPDKHREVCSDHSISIMAQLLPEDAVERLYTVRKRRYDAQLPPSLYAIYTGMRL